GFAIFGGTMFVRWGKAAKFFKELGEAATKTSEAMDENSPGGMNITGDEAKVLLKEWYEAWQAWWALLPAFIKKLVGK
ncbi:unnamed protein product, partial [marine sediment metagenome]